MAFRNKFEQIAKKYDPDVMLIQECEEKIKDSLFLNDYDITWIGDNKNKGVATIVKKCYESKKIQIDFGKVKYAILTKVNGVNTLNFWAMNDEEDKRQRYIGQVYKGLRACEDYLKQEILIAGDFNWNICWDQNPSYPLHVNFADVLRVMEESNIKSIYHVIKNETHGEENEKTFYMYRKKDKSYHTDYCFASDTLISKIKHFEIGKFEEWKEYSDHMPLFLKITS